MTIDINQRFPIDWDVWRAQWKVWKEAHTSHLRPLPRWAWGLYPEQKNFMADDILGRWLIKEDLVVELSDVTFPNLEERDDNGRLLMKTNRFVGLTFRGRGGQNFTPDNGLVSTFAELEERLGFNA